MLHVNALLKSRGWLVSGLALGTLLLVSLAAYHVAGTWNSPHAARSAQTRIKLSPLLSDEAHSVTVDFIVKNDSENPVVIKDLRPSCGCSKAELDHHSLAPGDQTTLHLQSDLHLAKGQTALNCQLFRDDGSFFGSYTMQTTVYQRLYFPVPMLLMGQLDPNKETTRELTIITHGRTKHDLPRIATMTTAHPDLHIGQPHQEESVLPDGMLSEKYKFNLRLAGQTIPGRGEANIVCVYSYPGFEGQAALPVVWHVRSSYQMIPSSVFLVLSKDDKSASQVVRVRHVRNEPISVRRIVVPRGIIQAHILNPGPEGVIKFAVDAKDVNGPLSQDVTVETDVPTQPIVKVPVTVFPQFP